MNTTTKTAEKQIDATQVKGKRKYTKKPKPRGRPRKKEDEARNIPVLVYFDKPIHDGLKEIKAVDGRSMSAIIYDFVVKGSYKEPLTTEQTKLLRSLYNMANNLNQIAHQANINGMYEGLARKASSLADEISEAVIKFKESI